MNSPKRYSLRFFYDYVLKAPKKIVKKPQKLGNVTIFSYICNRIHKECGK